MVSTDYSDIVVEKRGQIGIIKFNRPKALNSFGGNIVANTIAAFREFNEDPDTVFTVLTGEGRFFSAGADVKGVSSMSQTSYANAGEKKLAVGARLAAGAELVREIIDHKKVVILALNGPAVGAGAAWFSGISDIVLAAKGAWLQIPFSALGLVPEMGSAVMFAQSIGVHRANEILMFGRRVSVEELMDWGLVNHIFPVEGFQEKVISYLEEQLSVNDGKSMMEVKRLQYCQIRDQRITALANAVDALAERFVEDAPTKRFEAKRAELEAKSKAKDSKL